MSTVTAIAILVAAVERAAAEVGELAPLGWLDPLCGYAGADVRSVRLAASGKRPTVEQVYDAHESIERVVEAEQAMRAVVGCDESMRAAEARGLAGCAWAAVAMHEWHRLIKESHARGAKPRRLVGLRLLQGGAA